MHEGLGRSGVTKRSTVAGGCPTVLSIMHLAIVGEGKSPVKRPCPASR